MVRPSSVTVPVVIASTPLLLLASMVTSGVPLSSRSPSMVRFLPIDNSAELSVTVMPALNVMVSPDAASLIAWRSVPTPLFAPLVTVMVARSWWYCCVAFAASTGRADTSPVRISSCQSPPAPVRLLLAATSAPVSCARLATNCAPASPLAMSQAYTSRSPSAVMPRPIAASASLWPASVSASRKVPPSHSCPALPWARICTAPTSPRSPSAAAICARPSSADLRKTISAPGGRSCSRLPASSTRLSTKTISRVPGVVSIVILSAFHSWRCASAGLHQRAGCSVRFIDSAR